MQIALFAILTLASLALLGMGVAQRIRRNSLARVAHEIGMKFSPQDPFELSRRYGLFALMQSGHSAYANNVLFGRLGGHFLRVFEYRFEAGHGPHRTIRRFGVVAAEMAEGLGSVAVWRTEVCCPVCLAPPQPLRVADGWKVCGDENLGRRVALAWPGDAQRDVGIEAQGQALLFITPKGLQADQVPGHLRAVVACLDRLAARRG